jgi:hypothetical protein
MAALYMERILYVKNYKRNDDVNSEVTIDVPFYSVTVDITKLFIKMKTIFLWLCRSVDNERISLKFRL